LSHHSLILHSFACDNAKRENSKNNVSPLRIWMVMMNVMQEKLRWCSSIFLIDIEKAKHTKINIQREDGAPKKIKIWKKMFKRHT